MSVPTHHKAIARHLRELFGEPATVTNYRDDYGQRPVAIGEFGPAKSRFYSTIGLCDRSFSVRGGRFELAAAGQLSWLPNALTTSAYWFTERNADELPLVCEDVVKANVRSPYRHMAYMPSKYQYEISVGTPVRWLLGVPLKDSEIGINLVQMLKKVQSTYPEWLMQETQCAAADAPKPHG